MGPLPEEGYKPEKWQHANGAGNVTPAFTPVSRRVAPCAVFGEGGGSSYHRKRNPPCWGDSGIGSGLDQSSADSGSKSVQVKGAVALTNKNS